MNAAYITPAVTLLNKDGSLDLEANGRLYDSLIDGGIDGILVLGSIGEFFGLDMAQKRALADYAITKVDKRTHLIIGTGSMVYDEVVAFSNECLQKGADAVIVVSPYYFPLSDEAAFSYFDRLAGEVQGPLYLYNFPDRTGYTLSPAVVAELAKRHANIVGIKDTIGGMDHTRDLIAAVKPLRPEFKIYSGFDVNLTANVLAGGDGCISGLSNIFPDICCGCAKALRDGDMPLIAKSQQTLEKLMEIYAIGSNFIPIIKEAVRLKGVADYAGCTFPLPSATPEQSARVRALLEAMGLTVRA